MDLGADYNRPKPAFEAKSLLADKPSSKIERLPTTLGIGIGIAIAIPIENRKSKSRYQ
jgi:hypothetical protein